MAREVTILSVETVSSNIQGYIRSVPFGVRGWRNSKICFSGYNLVKSSIPLRSFLEANMVLLPRLDVQTSTSSSGVYTGIGYVAIFFFYFENFVTQTKEESKKPFELLSYLDGPRSSVPIQHLQRKGRLPMLEKLSPM